MEGAAAVRLDGTVLVTGGLGGLGLAVARRYAERGVAHLVLVGRRGLQTPGASEGVEQLQGLGARVTVASVDVADVQALQGVVASLPSELPLRAVVHAAGVLDDGMLSEQTASRFERVLSPKVQGAWNLHTLTESLELDAFVLFSSMAGAFGSAGQGGYAAANTYLDGLAAHRRARGLPAQSLGWGPWAEQGMARRPRRRPSGALCPQGNSQSLGGRRSGDLRAGDHASGCASGRGAPRSPRDGAIGWSPRAPLACAHPCPAAPRGTTGWARELAALPADRRPPRCRTRCAPRSPACCRSDARSRSRWTYR